MHRILSKIDDRFRLLRENAEDLSWKSVPELRRWMQMDEVGPGYHALRAIAGPCTDHPVWAADWTSPNGHTYHKGEPAPRWTEQEIHMAMAPQINTWARSDVRHAFGKKHGARQNQAWVDDAAMNIHLQMQRALQQEKDEGRILSGGGFVSWIASIIKHAGRTGVGSSNAERNAKGRVGDLLSTKSPARAREIAAAVGDQFRTTPSHKLDPKNPYGQFSAPIAKLADALADALEAGDQAAVDRVRGELEQLDTKIRNSETLIQGTDTGRRDISTPHGGKEGSAAKADLDKFMHTGIASVDTPIGDGSATLGSTIVGEKGIDLSGMDKEIIYKVLELGRAYAHEQNPKILRYLEQEGLTPIGDGDYRYLIRLLAPWLPGGNYPGKGQPGKDPEMSEGGETSDWVKNGQPHLMERDQILQDISQGGPGKTSGGIGLQEIANMAKPPLTPVQADYVALICGVNPDAPGKKMSQADISRFRGVSKVNVSTKIKGASEKLGMTMAELMELVQLGASGGGAGAQKAPQISKDPLAIFQRWMQQYVEEQELDESLDWVDRRILAECYAAVTRLAFWMGVKPIIEGRQARLIPSRKTMGRVIR